MRKSLATLALLLLWDSKPPPWLAECRQVSRLSVYHRAGIEEVTAKFVKRAERAGNVATVTVYERWIVGMSRPVGYRAAGKVYDCPPQIIEGSD